MGWNIFKQLNRIELKIDNLTKGETKIMADLSGLIAAVAKVKTDLEAFIAKVQAGTVTQADIDAITASVSSIDAEIPPSA